MLKNSTFHIKITPLQKCLFLNYTQIVLVRAYICKSNMFYQIGEDSSCNIPTSYLLILQFLHPLHVYSNLHIY